MEGGNMTQDTRDAGHKLGCNGYTYNYKEPVFYKSPDTIAYDKEQQRQYELEKRYNHWK